MNRSLEVPKRLDGQTNQLIGEYADTQFGKQYVPNLSKGVTSAAEQGWDQYWEGLKS